MVKNLILILLLFGPYLIFAQKKPNIIYIMADDLGYADLSCYGRKDYQTPNLDKLASQGVKFMNAYAGAPLCTPTRTSFMTGRYPARTPVGLREPLDWHPKDSLVGLTPEFTSLPALLKKTGYTTSLLGKWHLGFTSAFTPNINGFDEFFGSNGGGVDYVSHTDPKGNNDLYENDKSITRSGYMTDLLMERAIGIIKRKQQKPFFLCLMFNAPHWPWQAPGDKPYPSGMVSWKAGGSNATYAAMVKSMDEAVGRIIQAIDEEGLTANTVLIFTSDNGGERFSNMGELTGGKPVLWEGGIKVPAFIRWPGKIPPNTQTDQAAITMDWTATILSLAGSKPDPAFPPDGIDLMPVCTGKQQSFTRTFYWRVTQRNQQKAIRDGSWKYLKDEKAEYLFNVSTDTAEKIDLKEKEKGIFERLKHKYAEWEKTVLEPVALNK